MAGQELAYEEVLEFLADRKGDEVTIHSFPTYPGGGGKTLLGLSISAEIGEIKPVDLSLADFVAGQAAVRVELIGRLEGFEEGLVLTREWFGGATLFDGGSDLRIVVRADTSAEPLYSPVGQEGDPDEPRDVREGELVGWGFAFDFDGSAPFQGRWAEGSN
jgi:hypothetical protein